MAENGSLWPKTATFEITGLLTKSMFVVLMKFGQDRTVYIMFLVLRNISFLIFLLDASNVLAVMMAYLQIDLNGLE